MKKIAFLLITLAVVAINPLKAEELSIGTKSGSISTMSTMSTTSIMNPQFFLTPGYGQNLRDLLHYSQAVRIGDRIETSGQGGWSDDLQISVSLEEEIAQAFRNVEKTLATAGATWENVVHVNSYHVGGFPPEVNQTMTKLYRKYMPNHAPIWTQVGVQALGLPTMRFEIRVTAVLPSK